MDRDRKSPGLKQLQGLIWEHGYQAGELRGQVFPMSRPPSAGGARRALIAIYSSGSELAQRRLFATTGDGDLTPLIDGFFDTAVGAKVEAASYARIAAPSRCRPATSCSCRTSSASSRRRAPPGARSGSACGPGMHRQDGTDQYVKGDDVRGRVATAGPAAATTWSRVGRRQVYGNRSFSVLLVGRGPNKLDNS